MASALHYLSVCPSILFLLHFTPGNPFPLSHLLTGVISGSLISVTSWGDIVNTQMCVSPSSNAWIVFSVSTYPTNPWDKGTSEQNPKAIYTPDSANPFKTRLYADVNKVQHIEIPPHLQGVFWTCYACSLMRTAYSSVNHKINHKICGSHAALKEYNLFCCGLSYSKMWKKKYSIKVARQTWYYIGSKQQAY